MSYDPTVLEALVQIQDHEGAAEQLRGARTVGRISEKHQVSSLSHSVSVSVSVSVCLCLCVFSSLCVSFCLFAFVSDILFGLFLVSRSYDALVEFLREKYVIAIAKAMVLRIHYLTRWRHGSPAAENGVPELTP